MTTPELITQQRELARSLLESFRQHEHSLQALQAAREREIAVTEKQGPEIEQQFNAELAEYFALEQIARSKVRGLYYRAFEEVSAVPAPVSVADPIQVLAECKLEIEGVIAGVKNESVYITFVTVPSNVDANAVTEKLKAITGSYWILKTGHAQLCKSLNDAQEIILEMKKLGVTVELVV